jgi:ABC-type Co2+ transport system permease subunit
MKNFLTFIQKILFSPAIFTFRFLLCFSTFRRFSVLSRLIDNNALCVDIDLIIAVHQVAVFFLEAQVNAFVVDVLWGLRDQVEWGSFFFPYRNTHG